MYAQPRKAPAPIRLLTLTLTLPLSQVERLAGDLERLTLGAERQSPPGETSNAVNMDMVTRAILRCYGYGQGAYGYACIYKEG